MNTTEQNKAIVRRFNKEVIEQGNVEAFKALISDEMHNHAAAPGASTGADGMLYFLFEVLRKGIPDVKVEILDQVAEGDKVTSRKILEGTHSGDFMGIPATGKKVQINVIDMIQLRDGKYVAHWGLSNIPNVLAELAR